MITVLWILNVLCEAHIIHLIQSVSSFNLMRPWGAIRKRLGAGVQSWVLSYWHPYCMLRFLFCLSVIGQVIYTLALIWKTTAQFRANGIFQSWNSIYKMLMGCQHLQLHISFFPHFYEGVAIIAWLQNRRTFLSVSVYKMVVKRTLLLPLLS